MIVKIRKIIKLTTNNNLFLVEDVMCEKWFLCSWVYFSPRIHSKIAGLQSIIANIMELRVINNINIPMPANRTSAIEMSNHNVIPTKNILNFLIY